MLMGWGFMLNCWRTAVLRSCMFDMGSCNAVLGGEFVLHFQVK